MSLKQVEILKYERFILGQKTITYLRLRKLMDEYRRLYAHHPEIIRFSEYSYNKMMSELPPEHIVRTWNNGTRTLFGLEIEIDHSLEKNEWLVGQKFEQMKYV